MGLLLIHVTTASVSNEMHVKSVPRAHPNISLKLHEVEHGNGNTTLKPSERPDTTRVFKIKPRSCYHDGLEYTYIELEKT